MKTLKSLAWLLALVSLPGYLCAQAPEAKLAEAYYLEENYTEAAALYESLLRNETANEGYFTRAVDCLLRLERYEEAEKLVDRTARKEPKIILYPLYLGKVWLQQGRTDEAVAYWRKLVLEQPLAIEDFGKAGSFFYQERQNELARDTYLAARAVYRTESLFCSDLANIFASLKDYEAATNELLQSYYQKPSNLNLIKSQILQLYDGTNARPIEKALLRATQKHGNDIGLKEILQDFYLQTEAFHEALLQARSLDLLLQEEGERLFDLALVFQNNGNYALSNRALNYIIDGYRDSRYFLVAYLEKAKNYELEAFAKKPVDTLALQQAAANYTELFERFGQREEFVEALYRRANLYIFYLNALDLALADLQTILNLRLTPAEKAEAKLLEGDIYLLKGDYSKAKIAYMAIEEGLREGQAGAKAKFRMARLAYYHGDFEEAKARLNILKDNTSNDIANDAIRLLLTIIDNTGLDSTTTALQAFANVQLLIYQKRFQQALPALDSILYSFPNHPLSDDILWEKANLYLKLGDVRMALAQLEILLRQYSDDVWGDDALFLKAELYQYALNDPATAADTYLELLKRYSGSVLQVEARKRARKLRGEQGS